MLTAGVTKYYAIGEVYKFMDDFAIINVCKLNWCSWLLLVCMERL